VRLRLLASAILVVALAAHAAGNWPQWRGPEANGSLTSGEFPVKWDASNITWKVTLPGKGTSTPIVHGERIYVTSPADGQDALLAFDFNGRSVWQVKLGPEAPPKHRTLASSGNASPITDGKAVFVYFKSGNFAAVDFDGKIRWKINLVERFGRDDLFWDQGTSPMLTDEHVIMARLQVASRGLRRSTRRWVR
jgi:outer membrane protein assembly factor BamB